MVVSADAARLLFPDRPPIGGQVRAAALGPETFTVVGVVKNVRAPGVAAPRLPQLYIPFGHALPRPNLLTVRYDGAAAPLAAALRRLLAPSDPVDLRYEVSTLQTELDRIVAPRRFNSVVIDVFAALALLLAAVGLHGVMAYQVAQRTPELGIRMALGADRGRVLRLVLREGMSLALAGTGLGCVLSLALSQLLAGMLFEVSTYDVTSFALMPAVLIVVGLVACYLPARRATKVEPTVALRYE
jgi:putative ABC transport system permease protein